MLVFKFKSLSEINGAERNGFEYCAEEIGEAIGFHGSGSTVREWSVA